jgi:hypothetical protein
MAVTRYGEHICFAEWWQSSAYGKAGPIPESDPVYNLDDIAATIHFLESDKVNVFAPNGFADNQGKPREVYRRVMDNAAKGWSSYRESGKD